MKFVILFFLLGLCLSYDAKKAAEFALDDCTNPKEIDLFDDDPFADSGSGASFVTQCLIAGGFDISNCLTNGKGSISNSADLSSCLTQKGWKSSTTRPNKFKAGYPLVVFGDLWFIATEVDEVTEKYTSSSWIPLCNEHLGSVVGSPPVYYYLD